MRHIKNITWCLYIGCVCALLVSPAGASQPRELMDSSDVAGQPPCTEYGWMGKALVKGFDGELHEIIGRGTVCAHSRNEARKLAHDAMFRYASQFGAIIYCGADLTG